MTDELRAAEIAHAREVDTEVARLYGEWHQVHDNVLRLRKRLAGYRASLKHATGPQETYYGRLLEEGLAKLEPLELIDADYKRKADEYNDENYKGWSRFFLVQHIHNTMYCPSFRPTTRIGWLPNVSGLTAEEAVAEHGETLCTKCFPDAPVALTQKPVDPTLCAGSGGPWDAQNTTGRERSYYSPDGHCPVCGARVSLTARYSGKLRKHKAPTTKGA